MRHSKCPLCGATVDDDVWEYHRAQEDRVIEIIKQYNHAWILPDGSCPKAIDYYRETILKNADEQVSS